MDKPIDEGGGQLSAFLARLPADLAKDLRERWRMDPILSAHLSLAAHNAVSPEVALASACIMLSDRHQRLLAELVKLQSLLTSLVISLPDPESLRD